MFTRNGETMKGKSFDVRVFKKNCTYRHVIGMKQEFLGIFLCLEKTEYKFNGIADFIGQTKTGQAAHILI
jgi:hypothetical protein